MFDPEKFGEAMGEAIKAAVAPLQAKIKELESSLDMMADAVRDKGPTPGSVGPSGKDGAPGEKGADGIGLAGAMIDRDGNLQITMTNGEVKNLGPVVGKDGINGTNGTDGKDGLSLDSFDMEYIPESHEIAIKAVCQGRSKEIRYSAGGIRPAGYWREGTKAKAGEAWVHDGSLWVAMKDCASKPATNDDGWIIAARKGRDGENGKAAKPVDNSPIKLIN